MWSRNIVKISSFSGTFARKCSKRHSSLLNKQMKWNASSFALTVRSFSAEKDIELMYTTYPSLSEEEKVSRNKKPIVMLHGLFGARGNFHSICKLLSQDGRRIIPYDARNHGDSEHRPEMSYQAMAEDLLGLLTDLKLDKPLVLGHSMGGKTAMTAALTQPDALTALIVGDVSPNPSPNMSRMKDYVEAMRTVQIPDGCSIVKARTQARVQMSSVVQDRMVLEFLLTNLREYGPNQIRWRVNVEALADHMDDLGKMPGLDSKPFTKPTLFVFGANSEHYKNADMGLIKALFPSVQIEVIQGANHFLHADKPLEFVEIVKNFAQGFDTS